MLNKETNMMEEKIELKSYHSAEALKEEVGKRLTDRASHDWDIVGFSTRGSYLYLTFKQKQR